MSAYQEVAAELTLLGLIVRGGFRPTAADGLDSARCVLLVGNAGPEMWPVFSAGRRDEPDPLDRWTRRVLAPIAERHGARLVMPSDGPPYAPFQRWARRVEPVHPSPLGLLIHPEYGLWHAYRAALLFEAPMAVPAAERHPSPCAACRGRPCLTACPVGAFSEAGYDAARCRGHLGTGAGAACLSGGCLARHACPVGRAYAPEPEQAAFHMAAFHMAAFLDTQA